MRDIQCIKQKNYNVKSFINGKRLSRRTGVEAVLKIVIKGGIHNDVINTGNPIVDAIFRINFTGNLTSEIWYKTISNEKGKPNLLAITILIKLYGCGKDGAHIILEDIQERFKDGIEHELLSGMMEEQEYGIAPSRRGSHR